MWEETLEGVREGVNAVWVVDVVDCDGVRRVRGAGV